MADQNSEIDVLLHDYFQRNHTPVDTTGIEQSIASRVASGDTGYSLSGSSAPGHGGFWSSWVTWVGVAVACGLAGTGLGLGGAFGRPTTVVEVPGAISSGSLVPVAACPGGPTIDRLSPGTRVLAVQRDSDGEQLGIRNPNNWSQLVWIAAGSLDIDHGQASPSTLPEGKACPTYTVTISTPPVEPSPEPSKPSTPNKPKDTTSPTLGVPTHDPNSFGNSSQNVITVSASDNVAVTKVKISWTGAYTGSGVMTKSGNNWTYTFVAPGSSSGNITFTLQAEDAAGNESSPAVTTINYIYLA
ncbi:MAG: hypothetical protein IT191_05225 [Microbacteriaceae bacterium]|nr:hypothetical protein [Microbacteriaceae bacterium]